MTTDALLGIEKDVVNERYSDVPMYHEVSYTSKLKIFNIPLVDVYFRVYRFHLYRSVIGTKVKLDTRSQCAKGIIAIGTKAIGLFTLSFFGLGLFGIGLFNIGIIASIGMFSISGLYAFGVIALSLYFAFGVVAVGAYAFGVLAYGMQIAFGVATFGNHTIGILANGNHPYIIQDGATCIVDIEHYKQLQFLIENDSMPGFLRSILLNVPLCK